MIPRQMLPCRIRMRRSADGNTCGMRRAALDAVAAAVENGAQNTRLCIGGCNLSYNYGGLSMMKKYMLNVLLLLVAAVCLLTGCGGKDTASGTPKEPKLKIVTTIFPEYSWVQAILGKQADKADVTLLVDKGIDLHSYQPSADDILKVTNADLFIYVGGESDEWVEKALKEAKNPKMKVINLMQVMGDRARTEEVVEGMQHSHEHHHDHDKDAAKGESKHDHDHDKDVAKGEEKHDHDHDKDAAKGEGKHDHDHDHDKASAHEHEPEYDEHVWLSLRNAQLLCEAITRELAALDPAHGEEYRANNAAYGKKLAALDNEYEETVKQAAHKTLLFGDRFPFRYLADDYGLKYFAAFTGCSAESEASFETIAFLARKMDELQLPAVLTIEGKEHKIAKTVVENTRAKNQKILTLDSMQSTTAEDVKKGAAYLAVMEKNLAVLKEALK